MNTTPHPVVQVYQVAGVGEGGSNTSQIRQVKKLKTPQKQPKTTKTTKYTHYTPYLPPSSLKDSILIHFLTFHPKITNFPTFHQKQAISQKIT